MAKSMWILGHWDCVAQRRGTKGVIAHLPPLIEKAMFINVICAGGIFDAMQ